MPRPCSFSKRRTRGNTSSPKDFIDCVFGHPDKMNWLTPAHLKSINASAISEILPACYSSLAKYLTIIEFSRMGGKARANKLPSSASAK
jgi:hypothetical protein